MPSNIEIKARVNDLDAVAERVAALADRGCQTMHQRDVFFNVPRGRLKLRFLSPDVGQLIFYERPDTPTIKQSQYVVAAVERPESVCDALRAALGVRGEVLKSRRIYMVGRTRIHLDEVERLGTFVELEVVLEPGEAPEDGVREAEELMRALGIVPAQLLAGAYVDMET